MKGIILAMIETDDLAAAAGGAMPTDLTDEARGELRAGAGITAHTAATNAAQTLTTARELVDQAATEPGAGGRVAALLGIAEAWRALGETIAKQPHAFAPPKADDAGDGRPFGRNRRD